MLKIKRNKFNNIPTICRLGHKHRSKGEALHCFNLHAIKARDDTLISIEFEKSYSLTVNGIKICNHLPDFTLTYIDRTEISEFKGKSTAEFKLKYKLFKAIFPAIKYNIVYQKPPKLTKKALYKQ